MRQFPSASQLLALLTLNKSNKNKAVDEFLQLTLDNMQSKGSHDEISGGFFRYVGEHIKDGSTPSSESLLIEATRLADTSQWDRKSNLVLTNSTKDVENSPFSYAYLIAISK